MKALILYIDLRRSIIDNVFPTIIVGLWDRLILYWWFYFALGFYSLTSIGLFSWWDLFNYQWSAELLNCVRCWRWRRYAWRDDVHYFHYPDSFPHYHYLLAFPIPHSHSFLLFPIWPNSWNQWRIIFGLSFHFLYAREESNRWSSGFWVLILYLAVVHLYLSLFYSISRIWGDLVWAFISSMLYLDWMWWIIDFSIYLISYSPSIISSVHSNQAFPFSSSPFILYAWFASSYSTWYSFYSIMSYRSSSSSSFCRRLFYFSLYSSIAHWVPYSLSLSSIHQYYSIIDQQWRIPG